MDAQGDISRTKMSRGGTVRLKKKTVRRKTPVKKVFRMRKEPPKPKRKKINKYHQFGCNSTLEDAVKLVEKEGLGLSEVSLEYAEVSWGILEPIEDYDLKLQAWMKRCEAYRQWREQNIEEVTKHKIAQAAKEAKLNAAKLAKLEKKKRELEKKLSKAEADMLKLHHTDGSDKKK